MCVGEEGDQWWLLNLYLYRYSILDWGGALGQKGQVKGRGTQSQILCKCLF